ncbi:MAG: ABC transporter permease subunit [Sulfolobaceae archaeon]
MKGRIMLGLFIEVFLLLPIVFILANFNFNDLLLKAAISPLINSLLITSVASTICFVISLYLSYILIRKSNIFTNVFLMTLNLMLSIPDVVLGISLLILYGKNGIMSILFGNIFINTILGIILAEIYLILPYSVMLVYAIYKNVNQSYVESAVALGARQSDILWNVYVKFNLFLLLKVLLMNIAYGLSIFGVIVIFSYYPKVMTTAIFESFQTFEYQKALAFSSYLLTLSIILYCVVLILEFIHKKRKLQT